MYEADGGDKDKVGIKTCLLNVCLSIYVKNWYFILFYGGVIYYEYMVMHVVLIQSSSFC